MSQQIPENNGLQELDQKQDRLLNELDRLNLRIEKVIESLIDAEK